MKKTFLLIVLLWVTSVCFAQSADNDMNGEPTRGGDYDCSGVVVSGSSATVTLCWTDYTPMVIYDTPLSFNVILPSGSHYRFDGWISLENVQNVDSVIVREVDALGNTIARLAKYNGLGINNITDQFLSDSTTGRFVFDIYCYYGRSSSNSGFEFTISPANITTMDYACAQYMGVGTCNPQKTLHVNGELIVSNPLYSSAYLNVQPSNDCVNMQSSLRPFRFNHKVISTHGFYSPINTNLTLGTNNTARITILHNNGNVGIGKITPLYKLDVAGEIYSDSIRTKAITVTTDYWADFVFEDNYELPSLEEVKTYIQTNGHLPEIQSAEQVQKYGVNMSDFQIQLLKKVEELTLYIIKQEERIKELESKIGK